MKLEFDPLVVSQGKMTLRKSVSATMRMELSPETITVSGGDVDHAVQLQLLPPPGNTLVNLAIGHHPQRSGHADLFKRQLGNDAKQGLIDASLGPTNAKEAAILTELQPGNYTAVVSSANNGTGVGVVEIYDITPP